ncbi:alpha/beta fold hydrolase [Rhodococcus sp. 24CO]|uniref:alpha/beta fold hydrolase n=1 Tax=Rhodococcus sp. 24CO TaxID=3117460 RepID=UPI003D329CE3
MSEPYSPNSTLLDLTGGAGRLAVELWDNPDDHSTLILLSHGGAQTRHSWRRTAERLYSDGWTVSTFDARGHGDSGWSESGNYNFTDLADDVVDIIDQLNRVLSSAQDQPPTPRKVILVGASMGGAAGLIAQARNPHLATALVLVDVTPRVELEGLERILQFVTAAPDGFDNLEQVAAAVTAYNPTRPTPPRIEGLRKNLRTRDGRLHWHWDPKFFSGGKEGDDIDLAQQLEQAAAAITTPTLLIRGSRSDIVTDEGVNTLRRLMPHAQVSTVLGAAHMVAGDDNDQFTTELGEFLRQHSRQEEQK